MAFRFHGLSPFWLPFQNTNKYKLETGLEWSFDNIDIEKYRVFNIDIFRYFFPDGGSCTNDWGSCTIDWGSCTNDGGSYNIDWRSCTIDWGYANYSFNGREWWAESKYTKLTKSNLTQKLWHSNLTCNQAPFQCRLNFSLFLFVLFFSRAIFIRIWSFLMCQLWEALSR